MPLSHVCVATDTDFTPFDGMMVTLSVGMPSTSTVTVSTTSDLIGEGSETFLLYIDDITGPARSASSFITLTITDDECKF